MKKLTYLIIVLILLMGCSNVQNVTDYKNMLPTRANFEWRYSGFVGYDHVMTLNTIETQGQTTKYLISGIVGDPSGGEAIRDFTLNIIYTLNNDSWVQEKVETMMMDSDFNRLEILKGPIRQGAKWTQSTTNKLGALRTLVCTIDEVSMTNNLRIIKVTYQDQASAYYEKRTIVQGKGLVAFEKLWISKDGNFPIGYALFDSGYR
ncbi:MAG: hypothetical protein Q8N36_00440 [bacterium]|nr:hypothetical protein [bacterium]